MKTFAMSILLLVSVVTLAAGCKKEPPPTAPEPVVEPAEEQTAEPQAAVEEAISEAETDLADAMAELKTAPAEAAELTETPWASAQPGTMVKTRHFNGGVNSMEVVSVNDESVTVKMTVEMPGMDMPVTRQIDMPRYVAAGQAAPTDFGQGEKIGSETLQVGDQSVECEVWQVQANVEGRTVTTVNYVCKDVPGWVVRTDSDMMGEMRTVSEVIEFKN